MSVTVRLPAICGQQVYGWLPALGLIRLAAEEYPALRVAWDAQDGSLILLDGPTSTIEVADTVRRRSLDRIPDGGALPGVNAAYPPLRARGADLVTQEWTGEDGRLWRECLLTDTAQLHPLLRMHAAQTLRGTLDKIASVLRRDPALLTAALTGLGTTEEYGAGLWMFRRSSDGTAPVASPGRDWLALMGLPWTPPFDRGSWEVIAPGAPIAAGWTAVTPAVREVRWSLWADPLPASAIPAVLQSGLALFSLPEATFVAHRPPIDPLDRYAPPLLMAGAWRSPTRAGARPRTLLHGRRTEWSPTQGLAGSSRRRR